MSTWDLYFSMIGLILTTLAGQETTGRRPGTGKRWSRGTLWADVLGRESGGAGRPRQTAWRLQSAGAGDSRQTAGGPESGETGDGSLTT